MKIAIKRNTIVEVITSSLILLFLYTALSKFLEFEKFKYVLAKSPSLERYHVTIAWGIPISELVIVSLLVIPRLRKIGLWSSFGLLLAFTVYISYMLLSESKLPCSCGGVIDRLTWPQHLMFNIGFTVLSFLGAIWNNRISNSGYKNKVKFEKFEPQV